MSNEILYEKIATLSDQKSDILKENDDLKKKIKDYNENLFNDFCDFVTVVLAKVDLSQEVIDESIFGQEKPEETKMVKYLAKVIRDKATSLNIEPKKLAQKIMEVIR